MVKINLVVVTACASVLLLCGFMVLAGPHFQNNANSSVKFEVSFNSGRDLSIELESGASFWDAARKARRVQSVTVTHGTRVLEASAAMIAVKIRKPSRQYWVFDGKALCVVEQKRFKAKMSCPSDALRVELEQQHNDK
jgi:hypothetical protein